MLAPYEEACAIASSMGKQFKSCWSGGLAPDLIGERLIRFGLRRLARHFECAGEFVGPAIEPLAGDLLALFSDRPAAAGSS